MSSHVPVDTDEDWSDIDIDLPEILGMRRRRRSMGDEVELSAAVRGLILAGLRDGSVPARQVAHASPRDEDNDQEPDARFETNLRIVLGDLGVLVDDATAAPDPSQPSDDDDEVDCLADEQLTFLSDLNSASGDPLTLYVKDICSKKILSRRRRLRLGSPSKRA
jgi:RNA polymerase primary sigma factor